MARPQKPLPEQQPDNINHEQFEADVASMNELGALLHEANVNATAVAKEFGYEGALTVGALEDEIRFYQRRTAEGLLELGKRLIILKELTPHGEFTDRIELLGFSQSSAKRFMGAAFKFSKTTNLGVLADRIGTQSKLLELVTMDDVEIEQLSNGETVRGLTLDEIDTMTASELKAALRKAQKDHKEELEAADKVIASRSEQLNMMEKDIAKLRNKSSDWHPRAFEIAIETTTRGAELFERIDQLHQLRLAILEEDFGEADKPAALEAMAVVYYDLVTQTVDRVRELVYECDEVFGGYKNKAKPILDVFGPQEQAAG